MDRPDRAPRLVSRVEERDRLLDAVMRDADTRDTEFRARPSEPPPRAHWASALALVVFTVAARVAWAPPAFLAGPPPVARSVADVRRGIETGLLLQAGEVEAYRAREGRLPDSLAQVGSRLPGVRYVRSDARVFQLVRTAPDGAAIVFDSALPNGGLQAPLPLPGGDP